MTHPLLRPQPLRAWQFEDLLDTPDDGYRYEILDGSLIVTPAPPCRTSPRFTGYAAHWRSKLRQTSWSERTWVC
ncbi:hypothetical protein ACFQZ4_24465 [Catellatospora coxensis]